MENKLVKGLDDIAITLEYEEQIKSYEKQNILILLNKGVKLMTVKTTVSSKDIDEAFLQLKDIVKETLFKRSLSLS